MPQSPTSIGMAERDLLFAEKSARRHQFVWLLDSLAFALARPAGVDK